MKKKFTFVIFYFCFFTFYSAAQPTQEWVARYERPSGSSGIVNQMALDKVGNCYVLGNTAANGGMMILIKYNSTGDTLWTRTYQQAGNIGVVADSNGNVCITGFFGPDFGPYNIVTIKYDPNGNLLWQKIYDSGGSDESKDIAIDERGNIYIAGISDNSSLIIKYNISGDTLWTRKYSENLYRYYVKDLILDKNNSLYICGERTHTTNSSGAMFTMKYDSNGVFKWINNPLISQMEYAVKIGVDDMGNSFVTGGSFDGKILTVKYDMNGIETWNKIYDGPGIGNDLPYDMKIDYENNIIVTGASNGINTGNFDFITLKYDTFGDTIFVTRYNGNTNENDEAYSIDIDTSNNYYITGRSRNGLLGWNYLTIKYSKFGLLQWFTQYNGVGNAHDIPYKLLLDKYNNVFVTGISDKGGILYDYVTIKYSQVLGIQSFQENLITSFNLLTNYPNPFNSSTVIKYQINDKSIKILLQVFDITGKIITTLVNSNQNKGNHEIFYQPVNLPSGIYFFKLSSGNNSRTQKMIYVK